MLDTPRFEIVEITAENVDTVGMYCSQSKRKAPGYQSKLNWIKPRFEEGLKYYVLMVDEQKKDGKLSYRGMIEFMPGETSWRGIDAPGYYVIHCLWVIGKHKRHGYGTKLIQKAIEAASKDQKHGVAVLTIKKGGWSPKKVIFENLGFSLVEEYDENWSLYAYKLAPEAPDPKIFPIQPINPAEYPPGFTVLSSCQCPYMAGTLDHLHEFAKELDVPIQVIPMESIKDVREHLLHPYATFHVLFNGVYLTHLPGGMRDIKKIFNQKIK